MPAGAVDAVFHVYREIASDIAGTGDTADIGVVELQIASHQSRPRIERSGCDVARRCQMRLLDDSSPPPAIHGIAGPDKCSIPLSSVCTNRTCTERKLVYSAASNQYFTSPRRQLASYCFSSPVYVTTSRYLIVTMCN